MNRYSAAVCGISRHFEQGIAGEVDRGVISRNEQVTLCVIAARISHDIHKALVHLIDIAEALSLAVGTAAPLVPDVVPAQLLVLGLKNELVAVVLELVADLSPDGIVFFHNVVVVGRELFQPAAVPVQVHDNVEISVQRPVRDLFYSCHILVRDGIASVLGHHI